MGRPAKALSGLHRTVGSNPTLSATIRGIFAAALIAALFIANPATANACATTYAAKSGDSWWSIAERHGLPLSRVLTLNKATTSTKILIGDDVCVAKASAKKQTQTAPAPKRITYTQAEITQIIREEWPDELEERALKIARRESKFNPYAVGIPNNCCYGLFQIYYRWHKTWLPTVGVTSAEQLLDPRLNARAAYRMYQRNSGWGPWE
jgi:soluble lytic murein transglycosylase-like protein